MNNFSIYHIVRLFFRHMFIIILSAILFGVSTFAYCEFHLEEKYAATGSVLVTNGGIIENYITEDEIKKGNVNNTDIAASINLLTTVRDILKTNDIYKQLSDKLGGKYTYSQLKGFATISKRDDYSLFIDVKFETNNREEAINLTNMFLSLTPEYISKFIPHSSSTVVTTVDNASKTYPKTASSVMFAMIIGAVLSFLIIYIISFTNATIQCEEDFKDRYDIPVLGDIPDFANAKSEKYYKTYYKGGSYYGR